MATVAADRFIGRKAELETLMNVARSSTGGLYVLSAPGNGVSELLRQTYDKLFAEQTGTIPFYFEFRRIDSDAVTTAARFARSFLAQALAYRQNDASLINSPLDIKELAAFAVPSDGSWISRIEEVCDTGSTSACLSAPARAAASGHRVVAIVDGLHELAYIADGFRILKELDDALAGSNLAFVLGSRRRFGHIDRRRRSMNIEPLSLSESDQLAENLSSDRSVTTNDQTRDLIAVQLQGNPSKIRSLFDAAAKKRVNLTSFREISSVYADAIFAGQLGIDLDGVMDAAVPEAQSRRRLFELLNDAQDSDTTTPIEVWQQLSGMTSESFRHAIDVLNCEEILHVNSHSIEPVDDLTMTDSINSRYLLEVRSRSAAVVKAELLAESLKRSPRLMARLYRKSSALGVRETMARFDCQVVPSALFDYGRFRDGYKGREHKEIVTGLSEDGSKIILPQLIYTDSAEAFDPQMAAEIEEERAAVATGFSESKYTDDGQIAWLAAEIDSKLEVTRELAEQWCDRLNAVAEKAGFGSRQIWLISPEGFSPEAIELLRARNAFGSSRQQAILLNRFLDPSFGESTVPESKEYEMVVPMGEDTELIAAHAVEEIARRHHFPQKAINQIKTALVEACINAVEHSLSPDRKIYQKFSVDADKINITVSNRGLRLADARAIETTPTGGRRGWGLSLMKGLMDEVSIEQVDDGTRIRMTKFLKAREN